jgi:hypothetical protein
VARRFDLKKALTPTMPELPVFALRFSPDGRGLALVADAAGSGQNRTSQMILLSLERPDENPRHFQIELGVHEGDRGRGELRFGWTPSGRTVYASGTIVDIKSSRVCELPGNSVFVTDDLAVSGQGFPRGGIVSSTVFTFYNSSCREVGTWTVPEAWLVHDVAPEKHLLSVVRDHGPNAGGEGLIVDPIERRVVQRWPWDERRGGEWLFADHGRAICHGGPLLAVEHAPASCRDVATGKLIAETRGQGVDPIAPAADTTRVIVSDSRRKWNPFWHEYETSFSGRYIWDFGTGQELIRWVPAFETYKNIFSPTKQIRERLPFAISPNGHYVAEGGNGTVDVYTVAP